MKPIDRHQKLLAPLVVALVGIGGALALYSLELSPENRLPAVAGGTPTNDYPAVVYLNKGCTASFISSRVLLTAAHCFTDFVKALPPDTESRDRAQVKVYWTGPTGKETQAEVRFISSSTSPLVLTSSTYTDLLTKMYFDHEKIDFDLALVILPESRDITPLPLCGRSPRIREKVSLVGFGHNEIDIKTFRRENKITGTGRGLKRIGTNSIESLTRNTILVRGKMFDDDENKKIFDENIILQYDSGGPLLSEEGCILGTVSGSYWSDGHRARELNKNEKVAVYERIDTAAVSQWIETVLKENP